MGLKNDVSKDPLLEKWLGEFKKETTRGTYYHALTNFKKVVGVETLAQYVSNHPDVTADVRKFLAAYDGKPSKTVNTYAAAIKTFLRDNGVKIPEEEWSKIKRRGFMPKRVIAETHDRKNSKSELRQILNYANIKTRAQVLFMVSAGTRVSETLQLKDEDLKLDADPPSATIQSEYTKGGVGGRRVYFSYEARDAIRDWLRIRDTTVKHTGGTWKSNKVFPWSKNTSQFMWNEAIKKANLDSRDNRTKRRIYHLHGLRKFFRSNIDLDDKIVNALMGHVEGLDAAYLKLEQEGEIAKEYKAAMPNVTIFTVEDQKTVEKVTALEEENKKLKEDVARMQAAQLQNADLFKRIQMIEKKLEELSKVKLPEALKELEARE